MRFALSLALLVSGAARLAAQTDFATVTGTVTDSTKSLLIGVAVSIRNLDTNSARTASTNEAGYYTITGLPPGTYEFTVSKAGFDSYQQSGIVLETGQQLRIDIELRVGSINQTVEVTAEIAPLNTQDGAIKGAVVVQQEIQDVPLDGRDFTDAAFLVPGVVPNAQGGAGSGMVVNGARGDNTGYRVDGFDDRNARGAAPQLRPNIDALEQFKMETSGFSAQYGNVAGGIMNMVLKTGTNKLHGTAFEYLRNEFFDARSFFDPQRLPLRRNQFGATASGPFVLPKVYDGHDRTFFLLSWESYRNTEGQTRLDNVPTLPQRAGNFKGLIGTASGRPIAIRNPFNNYAPFPGNVIPKSLFDPVALKILKWYPEPNYTGVGINFQATAGRYSNWDSILWKIDHRFSDRNSISVRYSYRWNPNDNPWSNGNTAQFGNFVQDNRSLGGVTFLHMFSPSLISESRIGFSRNAQKEHFLADRGQPTAAELGMLGSTTDPELAGFPKMNITNYAGLGFADGQPLSFFVTCYQLGNDFTWIRGKHVLKFGADISKNQFNQPYNNNARGTITVNGNWTGNGTAANGDSIADLLLGFVNSSSITANPTRGYLRWTNYGAYVNDDFRMTPKLTLNLGVRWEVNSPPHDKYGRMMNFIPELKKILIARKEAVPDLDNLVYRAGLTGMVGFADQYGYPDSVVFTNRRNFAPRLGYAYRAGSRTVIRGGYGWFYSVTMLNDIRNGLGTSFPFSTNYSWSRVAANLDANTLGNPWPVSTATLAGTNTSVGFQSHAPTAYMQNFNLTIEQAIAGGNVVEVGYVGSKGTHLGRRYNINMPYRTIDNYMNLGTFPVPYPPLGTINYWDFGSNSIYNAGQIMFRRRAAGGLFYRFAYTFSKSIDDASQLTGASAGGYALAIDARNLKLEHARSDFDRGHAFTAVFTYPLPVGRRKRFLAGRRGLTNAALGNWQISGTVTATSGQALTIMDSSVNTGIGESDRPNRLASGKWRRAPRSGRRGVDYPWYDIPAFVPTAGCISRTDCSPDQYGFLPFVPGNSGRNILDGPGMFFTNLNMFKSFPMAERRSFQFRAEAFNLINTPNFQLPNKYFNEIDAGIITGVQGQGRGGPRTLQFAVKFIF